MKLQHVFYVLTFVVAFSLAQLTRQVDIPQAIGYLVLFFCGLTGLIIWLSAMGFGAYFLAIALFQGGNRMLQDMKASLKIASIRRDGLAGMMRDARN